MHGDGIAKPTLSVGCAYTSRRGVFSASWRLPQWHDSERPAIHKNNYHVYQSVEEASIFKTTSYF